MPSLDRLSSASTGGSFSAALSKLADEAAMLMQALLSPGKIIDEVHEMRALQVRANGIEATDPARAAALRWQASRIGLR
jgi:hypothetical protein